MGGAVARLAVSHSANGHTGGDHPVTPLRDGGHIGLQGMMYVKRSGPDPDGIPIPRHPDAARIIRATS